MELEALPVMITAAFTIVSPLLAALFTKTNMSSKAKNWVAVGVSLVGAALYVFLTGGFENVADIATPLGVIYGTQQLIYNQFLKGVVTKVEATVGLKDKTVDNIDVHKEVAEDGSEVVIATPTNETPAKG